MRPLLWHNVFKEARKGVAAICLFSVLAVQAMVAVPALHALLHSDASDPSHQCAVTMFLHGQVHASGAEVHAAQRAPVVFVKPVIAADIFVSTDVRLLPSRGPPVTLPVI